MGLSTFSRAFSGKRKENGHMVDMDRTDAAEEVKQVAVLAEKFQNPTVPIREVRQQILAERATRRGYSRKYHASIVHDACWVHFHSNRELDARTLAVVGIFLGTCIVLDGDYAANARKNVENLFGPLPEDLSEIFQATQAA